MAAFFGAADAGRLRAFRASTVAYGGPEEWSYRRFILHYAHLCALAGGVDAFCIGSELRGLTQIRDGAGGYPAVRALMRAGGGCAGDPRAGDEDRLCRRLVGVFRAPAGRRVGRRLLPPRSALGRRRRSISSASTTTCRCRTGATGRAMPTPRRASIYDLDYLPANVAGGEGFDWFYAERRRPRRAGADADHATAPTARTGSFATRIWCAGGRAARRPPGRGEGGECRRHGCRGRSRSGSPSSAARRSTRARTSRTSSSIRSRRRASCRISRAAARDDLIQYRYLQATFAHWREPANNPVSEVYGGPDGRHVPRPRLGLGRAAVAGLSDADASLDRTATNYARGHWLNGRATVADLGDVVAEIAGRSGIDGGRYGQAPRRGDRLPDRGGARAGGRACSR